MAALGSPASCNTGLNEELRALLLWGAAGTHVPHIDLGSLAAKNGHGGVGKPPEDPKVGYCASG